MSSQLRARYKVVMKQDQLRIDKLTFPINLDRKDLHLSVAVFKNIRGFKSKSACRLRGPKSPEWSATMPSPWPSRPEDGKESATFGRHGRRWWLRELSGKPKNGRDGTRCVRIFERRRSAVPSPGGEGQGEGERSSDFLASQFSSAMCNPTRSVAGAERVQVRCPAGAEAATS